EGNIVGVVWTDVLETTTDGSDNIIPNLADNGGPTQTIALANGSPALNAGDPSAVAGVGGVPEFDQRGATFARIVGPAVDIGSFESENTAPVADNFSIGGDEDTDISGLLTATDAESNPLTFVATSLPTNGSVVVQPDGTFTYTPINNFNGTDSFTFTVSDGSLEDVGNVNITVIPVNDAPTIAVTAAAGFREEADAAAQHLQQSGTVSFDDVEAADRVSISATSNNDIVWSGGTIDPALAARLVAGFSTGVSNAQTPGSTPWTYDVEGVDLRFLDGGETISFSYTVTATDTHNATADATVQFVISGTNQVHVAVGALGNLIITGDEGSNVITVEARRGFVSVEGGEFTIVTYASNFNDGARFDYNALISLGDGANDLTIKETSDLPRELVVNTGSGNDRVSILETNVHRALRMNTGLGDDIVTLSSVNAQKGRIRLGDGNDRLIVKDAVIEESLQVNADAWIGGGDDWIEFTDVEVRKLIIKMGVGDDQATLDEVTAKQVNVDGGRGEDELTTRNNDIKKLRVKKVETR
ncbi:MAG: cadherin-like domain-containing protein, partial [Fuerstiella sp.]|nr:cadherin-like domain-containing protein [Fuerstiella sp.]